MPNNYNSTLQSNNTNLQEVLEALQTKASGGEQATPVISVSSNGLITATAGTKSSTHQLAFQAAKTITPSTVDQVAVSSGYYTGGVVTVNGDSDLVAGNIKSGVNIFGVTGTYVGSGGGDTSAEDGLITRNLTSYTNDRVTTIGDNAFHNYSKLTTVSFPVCTTINANAFGNCYNLKTINFPVCEFIGNYAFSYCSSLTTINFPACTTISTNAFYYCKSLTTVSFPVCTTINANAFYSCYKLTTVSFPVCTTISTSAFAICSSLTSVIFPAATTIGSSAFYACTSLTSIYLTNSIVCTLSNSNAFSKTGIWSNKGSIFVPSSLVASYKAATNWTFFSNRIYSA